MASSQRQNRPAPQAAKHALRAAPPSGHRPHVRMETTSGEENTQPASEAEAVHIFDILLDLERVSGNGWMRHRPQVRQTTATGASHGLPCEGLSWNAEHDAGFGMRLWPRLSYLPSCLKPGKRSHATTKRGFPRCYTRAWGDTSYAELTPLTHLKLQETGSHSNPA